MKLFVVAALIAVASAARLEHLERSYLPPGQGNYGASSNSIPQGSFGNQGSQYAGSSFGARDSGFGRGSNGIGSSGSNGVGSHSHGSNGAHASNGFGSQGSNGFGSGRGSNGFGSGRGSNGFGSNGAHGSNVASGRSGADAATINQYLPPDHGPSGSAGNFGSSIKPACSTCGSSFGSPQRYTNQQQPSFSSQSQVPATSYGTPEYQTGSNYQRPAFNAQQDQSQPDASRQYLAPKPSSFQNIPQQPFDEQTGYHY